MIKPSAHNAPRIKSVLTNLPHAKLRVRKQTIGATIHCSATPPSMDIGAKEVDEMHRARKPKPFLCIGYHFVIRREGQIEFGRPMNTEGSHCLDGGRNRTHIGICLIGGVSENPLEHRPGWPWNGSDSECNFTPPQMESLRALLDWLKLAPEGHRDVPNVTKACPSFDITHWLKTGALRN